MNGDRSAKERAESGSNESPKVLYRYLDRYGLDALANFELKVTPPNEFNDPLEFTPRFVAETDEDWRAYYNFSLRQPGFRSVGTTFEQFGRQFSITRNANQLQRLFQDLVSKSFLVLCLSEKPTSLTLWAHYAAAHTGLVLELDMASKPLQDFTQAGLQAKVRYLEFAERKSHPIHQIVNSPGVDKIAQMLLDVAAEKSKEWEREDERRLIVPLDKVSYLKSRLVGGRLLHFLQLEKSAISRVILGARASDAFEQEVRKVAALRGIPNERVVRAHIDRENFCVAT